MAKKAPKKEKEASPPKLKLDMGDSKPKVSKAKMFEQSQKEEKLGKNHLILHLFGGTIYFCVNIF